MRLSLKRQREIVGRFLAGESIEGIAFDVVAFSYTREATRIEVAQQVLRDYINGKFRLEPKGKRKP